MSEPVPSPRHAASQHDRPKRLPRSIWLLSGVSFMADVSSEMLYPILPLFLVLVLGATKAQLGLMEGAAVLMVALLAAWSGFRSDRSRRRAIWLRFGYGLPVLGKALIAAASVWPLAVAGRWLDRVGKGLRGAPRDALIADLVGPTQRGRAFGLHRAFDTAGALTGVLIAAWLLWWLTGSPTSEAESAQADVPHSVPAWVYRVVIAVSAVLGLGSWLLTWLVRDVSEQHREAERVLDGQVEPEVESLSADRAAARLFRPGWLGLPGRYWLALAALALFALANSSDAFLLLRASEAGFSPWAIVMIYATFNVSYALFSYPAGAWSDRIGRWRFIGAGWVLYILVYVGMALLTVDTRDWVWVLMGIYGLYMALTEGVGKALIADHAPTNLRGRAMGIFHATVGVCGLLASLLAGLIWDLWSGSAALMFGAACAAVAFGVLLVFARRVTLNRR